MKFKFFKKYFFLLSISFSTYSLISQESIVNTTALKEYNNAVILFQNKAYAAAKTSLKKVAKNLPSTSSLKADATFLEAMCAIKLNEPQADKKILSFIEQNPNSSKKDIAFFAIGNHYFAQKKAAHALKWYNKINNFSLSKEEIKELNFKKGYCYIESNNLTLAQKTLLPLLNDAKYGNDSRYYYGFASYKLEDYGIAESTLKEIADNDSYKAEISYYLLDISFKSGKFDRAIHVGLKLLPTIDKKLKSDVSKIIGESYFNQKKYTEAIPYLKKYKGKNGKWNTTDFYLLGYAYYRQKEYENAINNFNKIINSNNSIAQNAYSHLGECYMKLGKKNEALNAFKSASEMDFDKIIQEDAALNYAKLSYDAGNPFETVANVLQNYLKKYPNSKNFNEISSLVISSYINEKNFKGALAFLSKNESISETEKILEVSLYRAIQLYNENKFSRALPFFTKAKAAKNTKVKLKANYWEAQTFYDLKQYKEALNSFLNLKNIGGKAVVNMYKDIDYAIGYCYFNLNNYKMAINAFENFIDQNASSEPLILDGYLRLGDAYFAESNYKKAIDKYTKITTKNAVDSDYALYQTSLSYGFLNNNKTKITSLKKLVNNYTDSNLHDDALYQLANTYTKLKDTKNALIAYNKLSEKHPNSIFLPRALLRQGLLYFNENSLEKALQNFKRVTLEFPNTSEAMEAVSNARNVYINQNKLDEYIQWTTTLDFINISDAEIDNAAFEIAENEYLNGSDTEQKLFELYAYIKRFPNGIHKIKSNLYLASLHYSLRDFDKALISYINIINEGVSEYSEESLNKAANIYLNKGNYTDVIPILDQLEQEAYSTDNILFAQSNLMQGYYKIGNYELAIAYAKKLLGKTKITDELKNDAKIIIARASFENNDFETSEEYYSSLKEELTGILKAETLYYLAYFKNIKKEYNASNKIVQNLIANFSNYKYWGVKSYVVMGKNYYGLKDVYQATFVLENIITNFPQYKDIVKEATEELNAIKKREAKNNNSINTEKIK
ncbi:tetratricopeptide repeat protein [Polaribacter tangerinus]|uniref:tetratricopeptide repeat protein n=1 Tax=Polaribacter tangerinus TaxID=1920034 RepID=UPI000B4B2D91|nr:tetratricopeptide repeat protein [Polaribacter tangerinus]